MNDFQIEQKECRLCGSKGMVKFRGHYYFCPRCSCIYTHLIIMESRCSHIKEDYDKYVKNPALTVFREPRDRWARTKIYIINGKPQTCSICGAICVTDKQIGDTLLGDTL